MRAAILLTLLATGSVAQEPQYSETITVARYFVDVRVVDSAGRAMTDLGPADFQVDIGGRRARDARKRSRRTAAHMAAVSAQTPLFTTISSTSTAARIAYGSS
jgi:hypothetical protein